MIFLYLIVILLPILAGSALALMKKCPMKAKYVLIFSALSVHSVIVAVCCSSATERALRSLR